MSDQSTVYIVDDDPVVRESVAALVDTLGVRCETYPSAEDFLFSYDDSVAGCLVTDLRMAGMSGLELLETLNGKGCTLPVVMITGFADVPLAVRAMQDGAVTVLEKPCRDQELWDSIRTALILDDTNRRKNEQLDDFNRRKQRLTDDESTIMKMMITGTSNKTIAKQLDIGLRTVEARRRNIFGKMNVDNIAQLVQLVADGRHLTEELNRRKGILAHSPLPQTIQK